MEFKDYYKVMGVARDATEAQIKQAYRRLARKYHPDVSKEKDAEARFKELGEAYEVLKSPEKRAAYDQLGQGPRPGEEFRPPPDWGRDFEFSGAGPARRRRRSQRFLRCAVRGGAGRIRGTLGDAAATAAAARTTTPRCMLDLDAALQGGSRTFTLRVPEIDAEGHLVLKERTLNVQMPKGILAGQTIRLAGQGAPGARQGPAGDLYIEVEFQPHPLYRVEGRDLYLESAGGTLGGGARRIGQMSDAGGTVDLKCPRGFARRHQAAAQGARHSRIPARRLLRGAAIALPEADGEKARAAYRALADALPFNPRASLGV